MTLHALASDSLYARLGGAGAVNAAVDIFYDKILADPILAPMLDGIDMARQREKQVTFLTVAFGGPAVDSGESLHALRQRLVEERGLNDDHFDAVVGHLGDTLAELGVEDGMIAEVAAIAETFRDDILGR